MAAGRCRVGLPGQAGGPDRAGFSVVELVVAIALTAMLLGLLFRSLASVRRSVAHFTTLSEQVEAARIARVLVDRVVAGGGVLDGVDGSADVRVHLPIGWAEACDSAFVWYGIRAPDPDRDSVVAVDSLARTHRVALRSATGGTCGGQSLPPSDPQTSIRDLAFEPDVPGVVLLRVFESGVIRIDDAVRYARLGTSRQPLTVAGLDPGASGAGVQSGSLRVVVVADSTRQWEREWLGR